MKLAISFVMTMAACGNVKANHLPDAPSGDDAAVDAAPSAVKVTSLTVTGDGLPDTNVTVIFEDGAGNLISDDPVDANGKAQAEMPGGGNVIVLRIPTDTPSSLNANMEVITGVKPGDDLTVGLKAFGNNTTGGGQTTMTANFSPVSGAATTAFFTECGSFPPNTVTAGPPTVTLTFRDSCHGATFDLLMVASGGTLVTPVFTKVVGITHVPNGVFTIPAGTTAMQNFTITAQNIDAQVAGLSGSRAALFDDAPIGQQDVTVATPVAGTNTIVLPFEQGLGTRSGVAVNWSRTDASNVQGLQVTTATLTNNITMDVAPLELPWVTNLAATTSGMTWTTVAKVTTSTAWIVFGAPNATGAALPPLPAKYARLDPHQQTVPVSVPVAIGGFTDYDVINGYDAFRQQARTLFLSGLLPNIAEFETMAVQRNVTAFQVRAGVR